MVKLSTFEDQIRVVASFKDLVSTDFYGEMNAVCWERQLNGDFAEIANKVVLEGNMTVIDEQALMSLPLSEQGQLAREIIRQDLTLLKALGASPILNVIEHYERDDAYPFFPTDVYSFHVDRSPIPTDTFLCTYYGASSELLPNAQVQQKILIPEIREALNKLYGNDDEGFESFLGEYFFDLHYEAKPNAIPISLGLGHLWKLAVDHPERQSLPCVHRAPIEKIGEKRLLLIC